MNSMPPVVDTRSDVDADSMSALVSAYASAKSRQDIDAALGVCDDAFQLYTDAFGVTARGQAQARVQLQYFFRAFPDYAVTLEGSGCNGYGYSCWGQLSMTMRGRFGGFAPTGRTARLPFICVFTFRAGKLAGERFYFSQRDLCTQLHLPVARFRRLMALASWLPVSLQTRF